MKLIVRDYGNQMKSMPDCTMYERREVRYRVLDAEGVTLSTNSKIGKREGRPDKIAVNDDPEGVIADVYMLSDAELAAFQAQGVPVTIKPIITDDNEHWQKNVRTPMVRAAAQETVDMTQLQNAVALKIDCYNETAVDKSIADHINNISKCYMVDINQIVINRANTLLNNPTKYPISLCNCYDMSAIYQANSFDVLLYIASIDCVNETSNPELLAVEFARVLKPGGYLLFIDRDIQAEKIRVELPKAFDVLQDKEFIKVPASSIAPESAQCKFIARKK